MTCCVPSTASCRPLQAVLWFGLLTGLAAPEASAAPPAPVAPLTSAVTRFTDNSNGTVTDGITGLIWLKDAGCFNANFWPSALVLATTLDSSDCGLTDGSTGSQWRLPNRNELQSLIDYTTGYPALPYGHPFTNVHSAEGSSSCYWSSTSYAPDTVNKTWSVFLYNGSIQPHSKQDYCYVWPVRGGQ